MPAFTGRQEGDKDYRTPVSKQSLGDAIRYLYDLNGKRLFPPEMDMDTIKVVHDSAAGGFALYEVQYFSGGISTATQNAPNVTIVSPEANLGQGVQTRKQRSQDDIAGRLVGPILDWETRLQTLEFLCTLDAAGAILLNGKAADIYLFMGPIVGALGTTVNIYFGKSAFQFATGTLTYRWNMLHGYSGLPSQAAASNVVAPWSKWIPAKQRITGQLVIQDGTVFPANSQFTFTGLGITVPMGVQLPL